MTAVTLTLPRLGETMEEATITGWLVAPGAAYRRGEALLEIETDKTVAEVPALSDGRMVEHLVAEGARVAVGTPIATVEAEAEEAPGRPQPPAEPASAAPAVEPPATAAPTVEPPATAAPTIAPPATAAPALAPPALAAPAGSARRRATPVARRLARQAGLDLEALAGTGRRGRIEARDIPAGSAGASPATGRIAFDAFGPEAAETILLLHGFAGDRRAWAAVAAILARAGARVVAPDLPAHGGTAAEADDLASVEAAMAGFAAALPGRVHLVGHSFGAVVATALAGRLGERVSRLTLVAPAGCGREIAGEFVAGMAAARTPGEVAHLLRLLGPRGGAVSDATLAAMAAETSRGRLTALAADFAGPLGQRADILRPLATLARRLPVRALFGTLDRVIPATHALALPPPVAVHFLPAGHMPQWDAPAEVADLILGGPAHD